MKRKTGDRLAVILCRPFKDVRDYCSCRKKIEWTEDVPMKIRFGETNRATQSSLWVQEENPVKTLGKVDAAPGEYGGLCLKKCIAKSVF